MKLEGIFIPIITPFKDGVIDFEAYEKLINYYIDKGVSGIVPLATTGESPTISEYEYENIIKKTMEINSNRVSIYCGLGGNNTSEVIKKLKIAERNNVNGILSVAPYYNTPSQEGLYEHFSQIAQATDLDIVLYNIPYRTGVNIENKTILRLSKIDNIVGIKDSSGDISQTLSLLINRPENFSVLTGDDKFYYINLLHGGQGGILAGAHLNTEKYINIYNDINSGNIESAFNEWKQLYNIIPLLFNEPNPTPIKYCLKKLGLINSSESRLPLVEISDTLKNKLNCIIQLDKY